MSADLTELIAERARLAEVHDRAKDRWQPVDAQFRAAVQPVADALSSVADRMLQTREAPNVEIARSYMWLGDALFDLAQGRHIPFGPAIMAYRTAEPYVRVAHDALVSAKYDNNLANILLRSSESAAQVEEAVRRYERALPTLRASEPAAAARLEVELARAQKMFAEFQQLEQEMESRRADLVQFLRDFTLGDIDPKHLSAVTALMAELASVEAKGNLSQALAVMDRIQDVFQQLMILAEAVHTGTKSRISGALMKLWSELTALALTSTTESEVRDQAFAVQRALLAAKFAITGKDESKSSQVFAAQVLPAAMDGRALLARNHLTWVTPFWPVAEVPSTLGVYVTASPARAELAAVTRAYGLEAAVEEPGRELAEARFGALRRAAVVIVDARDVAQLPAACYEVGIALVLGKPIVVLARDGAQLPFDIDLHPIAYDGSPQSKILLAEAIERVLLLPQRPADAGSLSGMIEAARLAFAGRPEYVDLLSNSRETPLRAAALLESLVRAEVASGRQHAVVRPAWFRRYPKPDTTRLFHVMAFRPAWANEVKAIVRTVCARTGAAYRRGDDARDQRIIRAIWDDLCIASHVLVDLTEMNPNVCLELGIAHTLGKNTLAVSQSSSIDEQLFPMLKKVRVSTYANAGELQRHVEEFLAPPSAAPHTIPIL